MGAGETAQQVRVLAPKPYDLSSSSRTRVEKERNDSCALSSDLHMYALFHTHVCIFVCVHAHQINKYTVKN